MFCIPRLSAFATLVSCTAALAALALAPAAHAQYCAAGAGSCNNAPVPTGDERITRVVLNTLDNTSGSADAPVGCYSNFTAMTTALDPGSSYSLFIYYTNSYGSSDVGGAWIDWNSNQSFAESGDSIALTRVPDTIPYFTATFAVPVNATPGSTRLRVKVQYQGTAAACGNASFGECEDYGIIINAATVGACCTGTSCSTANSVSCTGSNHYQGNGTSCTPNPCAGACCFPGNANCTVSDAASCSGGTFGGAGSTCSPSNPCGGACCANNACSVQLAANCAGFFIASGVCSPDPCQYCAATSSNCLVSSASELIGRVIINTIDNYTGNVNGPAGCFNDFTGFSTDLYRGNTYTITFTNPAPTSSDLAGAWIDWNQNRGFTDSGEPITLASNDGKATWTGTFTVPNTALVGQTRFRVRVQFGGTLSACGNTSFGEVEDYSINVIAATTGACCGSGGSCTITLPGSCAGAFQAVAVACEPATPCGGACCGSDGSCSLASSSVTCGGATFFNHVACNPMPCTGVCCDATSGTCLTTTNGPTNCVCGQQWLGNATSCSPAPCGQGACCLETTGACSLSTLIGCTANSARFISVGSVCSPTPCPATGACCDRFSGACSTSTDVQNCSVGRIFLGGGTSCTTNPCGGSCCNTTTGACTTPPSAASCTASGGSSFTASGACSPLPCVGACCNVATGACTTMTSAGCAVGTTIFRGLGSTCTASTCAGACCNIANRSCTIVAATTGCGSNITFMGLATSCPAGNICSGACCDNITRACAMSLNGVCPAGQSLSGTTCSPDTCPAGTCCNVVGTCSTKSNAGCTGTSFYSSNTTCAQTVCSGACCEIASGICTVTSGATTCLSSSTGIATSLWFGPGTTCTGSTCGVGACCLASGVCTTAIDSMSCVGQGTFMGLNTSCPSSPAGVRCYGEVQQGSGGDNNDTSGQSNAGGPAIDMAPGDQIVGASSGQNASGGTIGTMDFWQIHPVAPDRNPLSPGAIYKHTLILTSSTLNQRFAVVGTFQIDNHFSSETTTVSDAVSGTGFALHTLSWYGFGGSTGTVKLRVFGASNPVSMYTLTLMTVAVTTATPPSQATPLIDAGILPGGLMSFSTVGETTTDTDMWVFDSNFNPITGGGGWGSDDVANPTDHSILQSEVKKDVLTTGFYYLALTDYNLHTSELTPLGDRFQSKQAYGPTYPGVVSGMNISNSPAPMDVSFKIVDGINVVHHYPATKLNSYDVVWVKIFVNGPSTGACCKPDGACVVDSPTGCTGLIGGTYFGDGSSCGSIGPGACHQPSTGACCQADGSCLVSNQYDCQTYPGAYRGNNSTCAAAACTQSIDLATSSTGGFGGAGAMFMDVTAPADHGVTVTRFDYYASQTYNNVTFYPIMDVFVHASGSYVGHEFGNCLADTPSDWSFNTQVRTNPYPVGGTDAAIPVVLATPVTVPAGQTVGFYLVARQSGIQGSSAAQASGFTFSNSNISVFSHEGKSLNSTTTTNAGWSSPLSAINQSLCGRVYYTLVLSGVCCRGSTCNSTVTQANCVSSGTAGAAFVPSASVCNQGANITFPCCYADYNKTGGVTVADIFDFLNSWFAGSPFANIGTDGANPTLAVQNIFDFLNAWFAGGC